MVDVVSFYKYTAGNVKRLPYLRKLRAQDVCYVNTLHGVKMLNPPTLRKYVRARSPQSRSVRGARRRYLPQSTHATLHCDPLFCDPTASGFATAFGWDVGAGGS